VVTIKFVFSAFNERVMEGVTDIIYLNRFSRFGEETLSNGARSRFAKQICLRPPGPS
jgi:hypothetical protein